MDAKASPTTLRLAVLQALSAARLDLEVKYRTSQRRVDPPLSTTRRPIGVADLVHKTLTRGRQCSVQDGEVLSPRTALSCTRATTVTVTRLRTLAKAPFRRRMGCDRCASGLRTCSQGRWSGIGSRQASHEAGSCFNWPGVWWVETRLSTRVQVIEGFGEVGEPAVPAPGRVSFSVTVGLRGAPASRLRPWPGRKPGDT